METTNTIVIFGIGIVLGLIGGAGLVWFALRAQTNTALAIVRAESATVVEMARTSLLEQANRTNQESRAGLIAQAKDTVGGLVDPITKGLADLQRFVAESGRLDTESRARIASTIESISGPIRDLTGETKRIGIETTRLATALKSPTTRGRWGEVQLRNCVELAGMSEFCDFSLQTSEMTNGEARPDMTVRLPGGEVVFVDAKTPLDAYLAATETDDEERRNERLEAHAKAVRAHIEALARKAYHAAPSSVGFTVLFLPGENFLQAAMLQDPEMYEIACRKNVLLAGPMSLVTLLRSYSVGWRERQQEKRAAEIAKIGSELYDRFKVFMKHYNAIGTALNQANARYNDAAGSLVSRVLPSARRMHEMAAMETDEIQEPTGIDAAPRLIELA